MDTTPDGSRWADLAAYLCAPNEPARLLAPTDGNNGARPVGEGTPDELLLSAARAGGGLAVVASFREDLDAFDLDGCAEQVRPMILDAAARVGGALVYLAESGSDDSEHVVIGCPNPAARAAFLDHVDTIRQWSGVGERLDHRRGRGGGFRLPGSVSLKTGGGVVTPIREDGHPMSKTAATRRARAALKAMRLPLTHAVSRSSLHVDRGADPVAPLPPLTRAWSRRRPFTDAERLRLETDGTRGDRSLTAIRAAWALWCVGIRSWGEAGDFYASRPAFAKFAARRDGGRAHWEGLASKWAAYRGPVDQADQDNADTWISNARGWTDHDAVAALVAVIVYRFTDGRGTEARPIARRDLAQWIGCAPRTASARLSKLVELGAIVVARHHLDGPPDAATLFTLCQALEITDIDGTPLDPAVVLHPVWHVLGHQARAIWTALTDEPTTTANLSTITGIPIGDETYGIRSNLAALADAGLATKSGRGRGTKWARGEVSLTKAGAKLGVVARAAALAEQINRERALWHADTAAEREKVARALRGELRIAS